MLSPSHAAGSSSRWCDHFKASIWCSHCLCGMTGARYKNLLRILWYDLRGRMCGWVAQQVWKLIHRVCWLVGGLEHFFIFAYIGNHHPNWLSYFSEGWNYQPVGYWSISSQKTCGCNANHHGDSRTVSDSEKGRQRAGNQRNITFMNHENNFNNIRKCWESSQKEIIQETSRDCKPSWSKSCVQKRMLYMNKRKHQASQ